MSSRDGGRDQLKAVPRDRLEENPRDLGHRESRSLRERSREGVCGELHLGVLAAGHQHLVHLQAVEWGQGEYNAISSSGSTYALCLTLIWICISQLTSSVAEKKPNWEFTVSGTR